MNKAFRLSFPDIDIPAILVREGYAVPEDFEVTFHKPSTRWFGDFVGGKCGGRSWATRLETHNWIFDCSDSSIAHRVARALKLEKVA